MAEPTQEQEQIQRVLKSMDLFFMQHEVDGTQHACTWLTNALKDLDQAKRYAAALTRYYGQGAHVPGQKAPYRPSAAAVEAYGQAGREIREAIRLLNKATKRIAQHGKLRREKLAWAKKSRRA